MGRQIPFTKVPMGALASQLPKESRPLLNALDQMQDRLNEALRPLRQSPQQLVTAKGSIVAATADGAPAEHKVSATNGQMLMADSTQPTGLNWAPATFTNVKASPYNAKGDGITDDTAAIQAAYNAVKTAGGTLYFPTGTYLMNLTIADPNIQIIGAGKSANGIVNQYEGGTPGATILKPKDLTKAVIQVGDGTNKVNGVTVSNLTLFGDGTTATSDGIYQLGAHRVTYSDITVEAFGRDNISITSSTTQPSYYTHLVSVHSNNAVRTNLRLVYGPKWVTTIWLTGCSIQSTSVTPTWIVYDEGVNFTSVNSWFETPASGHGVYMRYDSQTSTVPPFWNGGGSISGGGGTTTLDSSNSTDILIDIDLVGTAFNHRTSTIYVQGVSIDGQIKWDVDATVVSMKGSYPNRMTGSVEILGPLAFNAFLNDSTDEQASPTTRILQGGGAAGNEFIAVTGSGFQIPGAAATGLLFGSGGRMWRSANGMLRFIPSGTPNADTQGISVTPHRQAVTYSASMTISVPLGTWAFINATNGTAFTINAPTSGGSPLSNMTDQRITITISNQSGGALGAITWNAAFKMATFTAPADTKQTSIDFQYDGTNWIQVSPQSPDVPN